MWQSLEVFVDIFVDCIFLSRTRWSPSHAALPRCRWLGGWLRSVERMLARSRLGAPMDLSLVNHCCTGQAPSAMMFYHTHTYTYAYIYICNCDAGTWFEGRRGCIRSGASFSSALSEFCSVGSFLRVNSRCSPSST